MSSTPEERAAATITLPPRMAIGDIAQRHSEFCEALAQGKPIAIDADSLERIDTAGLQCLTLLVRCAAERQQAISWSGVSPELAAAAARLGLAAALELPSCDQGTEN
jgi:anti-anti-sigma regulatory factor